MSACRGEVTLKSHMMSEHSKAKIEDRSIQHKETFQSLCVSGGRFCPTLQLPCDSPKGLMLPQNVWLCLRLSHGGSEWTILNAGSRPMTSKCCVQTQGRRASHIYIPMDVQVCQPIKCISRTRDQVKCRYVSACLGSSVIWELISLFLNAWCQFVTGRHNMHFDEMKSCTSECFW